MNGRKNQALLLLRTGRLHEAKTAFDQICKTDKKDIESWICLAQINAQLGQPTEVEKCCHAIIAIWPESHDAHYHLGCSLLLQGRFDDAAASFRHVLTLKPLHPLAHLHLGKSLHMREKYDEALAHYHRTISLDPTLTDVQSLIGGIHQRRANLPEAISWYRKALHRNPDDHKTHSDILGVLNYLPSMDEQSVFAEHLAWGRAHKLGNGKTTSRPLPCNPDKRLRIGYVSPDFRRHSVAYFFEPLLSHHDPDRFETFCYAEVTQPDATTDRFRSLARHWRDTVGMNDNRLTDQIRADGIDILVDLAGHTTGNRLLVFTAKPAPVQVTYLGYPNTTGIETMDYLLTDSVADPPGSDERCYSETLVRLPHGFLCYAPPGDAPPVSPLPAHASGIITYGSFNNLMKVTPEVISAWAGILKSVPGSRLVMKNNSFGDASTRERYLALFATNSISRDRLEFLPPAESLSEHLDLYSRVDIALDTFPYNGATTTCEALWMGVPVVTLAGTMHAGRVGVSLLSQVGFGDLIAQTPGDYIRIAVKLAHDLPTLAQLRGSLRERMSRSKLSDEIAFTQDVEAAYREMWVKWCIRQDTAKQYPDTL